VCLTGCWPWEDITLEQWKEFVLNPPEEEEEDEEAMEFSGEEDLSGAEMEDEAPEDDSEEARPSSPTHTRATSRPSPSLTPAAPSQEPEYSEDSEDEAAAREGLEQMLRAQVAAKFEEEKGNEPTEEELESLFEAFKASGGFDKAMERISVLLGGLPDEDGDSEESEDEEEAEEVPAKKAKPAVKKALPNAPRRPTTRLPARLPDPLLAPQSIAKPAAKKAAAKKTTAKKTTAKK
jgi:ribonuclease E